MAPIRLINNLVSKIYHLPTECCLRLHLFCEVKDEIGKCCASVKRLRHRWKGGDVRKIIRSALDQIQIHICDLASGIFVTKHLFETLVILFDYWR